MADSVAAVAMNASSKNHTPGRCLRQMSAFTPPFSIGMSNVSPVRLSVIDTESLATLPDAMPAPADPYPVSSRSGRAFPGGLRWGCRPVGLLAGDERGLVTVGL